MSTCYKSGDFGLYFRENMEALGLPVPTTYFDTYQTAIATITTIASTLKTLSAGATMAEVVGATVGLEKLAVAASVGAAAYTGAAIGSIAVATGRSLACGARMVDTRDVIEKHNLRFKGYQTLYVNHPQILNSDYIFRNSYGLKARQNPRQFEVAV